MNENIADNGGIKLAFNVRLCFNIIRNILIKSSCVIFTKIPFW